MDQIPVDCPHCATRNVATTARAIFWRSQGEASIFATCNKCRSGMILFCQTPPVPDQVFANPRLDISSGNGKKLLEMISVHSTAPEFPKPRAILHLPEQVQRAFEDAEYNRAEKRLASAATGYRLTIERALKVLHPDGKGMLNQRIRTLEKENDLPPAMIKLLDSVKFLGNDGAHDLGDPEAEDVAAGGDFTALLLTYLFELPERVRIAAEKRQEQSSAAK